MSLDDRSLREHLDRRADARQTNLENLSESVIAGLPSESNSRGPLLVRSGQAVALFAAAVAVMVGASQYLATINPIASPRPVPTVDVTTPPTATDQGGRPSLIGLAFSTTVVTVSGFETADITVTATFGGDVTEYGQMDGSLTPLVCLEKAGAIDPLGTHTATIARTMVREAGSNQWVATFRLTAGDSGRWQAGCLVAFDEGGHELNLDPAKDAISPFLDITGTHAPLLTMEFDPSPAKVGRPLEVFGKVTDEDTGDPYGDVVVTVGRDSVCAEGGGGETVTTNPNGDYTFVIAKADEYPVCTWLSDLAGILPGVNSQDPIAVYGMRFAHPTEP